jgi:20S proteasome subunit alpha 5
MARPFGVALLIAGWDKAEGPRLFHTDPSGTFTKYEAMAIGAGSEGANAQIQEEFRKDFTLEEAQALAMRVLKTVMEEKLTAENIEVSLVTERGYKALSTEEISALLQ